MRALGLKMAFVGLLAGESGSALQAHPGHEFESGVEGEAAPWTHLVFLDDPDHFQFAVVSDRTGSPRKGVFEEAVEKINWLRPEFVMSVGDLIRGNSPNGRTNAAEWDEFMAMIEPLEMPFFFLAGNHDIQAKPAALREGKVKYEAMREEWERRFGSPYYYFVYKNVLFATLFTNDGQEQQIGDEQVAYFREVLQRHEDARWTLVFMHHPLWHYAHESGFGEIEALLEGRNYTVFAGHQHRYLSERRQRRNHYILATTGGGSGLRGEAFGEFDHLTWITMTGEGPVLANLRLDGILPHDVTRKEDLQAALDLTRAAQVEAEIMTGEELPVERARGFLRFRNPTDRALRIEGEFSHNHHFSPLPGVFQLDLAAGEEAVVDFILRIHEPFKEEDGQMLEWRTTFTQASGRGEAPIRLKLSKAVPARPTEMGLLGARRLVFAEETEARLVSPSDSVTVRYTLDGSEPHAGSALYEGPVRLGDSAVVKARAFGEEGLRSRTSECRFEKVTVGKGLIREYYEFDPEAPHSRILPDFSQLKLLAREVSAGLELGLEGLRQEGVGLVYGGYFEAEKAGLHRFFLTTDDGGRLKIGDRMVIDDPVKHPAREAVGEIELDRGRHRFELQYFNAKRHMALELRYEPPGEEKRLLPTEVFSFDEDTLRKLEQRTGE